MPELPEVRFEIAGSVAGRRRYCPDFAEAEESNPGKPKIKFCGVERTDASFHSFARLSSARWRSFRHRASTQLKATIRLCLINSPTLCPLSALPSNCFGAVLPEYLASIAFVAGRPHDCRIEFTSEGLDIVRHSSPGMIKENCIVGATNEGGEGRSILVFH